MNSVNVTQKNSVNNTCGRFFFPVRAVRAMKRFCLHVGTVNRNNWSSSTRYHSRWTLRTGAGTGAVWCPLVTCWHYHDITTTLSRHYHGVVKGEKVDPFPFRESWLDDKWLAWRVVTYLYNNSRSILLQVEYGALSRPLVTTGLHTHTAHTVHTVHMIHWYIPGMVHMITYCTYDTYMGGAGCSMVPSGPLVRY